MISHFINQILFSFLEQRAIPSLPSPLTLPHLAAYTFIPRGTAAAARERGDSRYNFRENGHITQLLPTGFPAGLCSQLPTAPASPVQCFWSLAVLFGNGEIIA